MKGVDIMAANENARIALRARALSGKWESIFASLKTNETQKKKYIENQIKNSGRYFSKAQKDVNAALLKCENARKNAIKARDNARKIQYENSSSTRSHAASKSADASNKAEYLNPIVDNLGDIKESLEKLKEFIGKELSKKFQAIKEKDFCANTEQLIQTCDQINNYIKKYTDEKNVGSGTDDVERIFQKIEAIIDDMGKYTLEATRKCYQNGLQKIQIKTLNSKSISVPSASEFEKSDGMEKLKKCFNQCKTSVSLNKKTPSSSEITYQQAITFLGQIVGTAVKISEFANKAADEIKEYNRQIDHLLLTFRGVARLIGKTLYKLLPAIVGCAAGVSGLIGALEETVVETVLWLTSAVGYSAYDIEGWIGELKEIEADLKSIGADLESAKS